MSRRNQALAWFLHALAVAATCATADAEGGPARVDLELVLAVDVSDSMSRDELLLQRRGYVAALRSADVAAAIASRGSIALAYVEWAGPAEQRIVMPWTILSNAEDAARFADGLNAAPLKPGFEAPPWEQGTAISEALIFAASMLSSGWVRRVIDISGDGPQNIGGDLSSVHDRIVAEGITINGLPIIPSRAAASFVPLSVYYEDCVIGGPGAFAIAVNDPSLFEVAIRRKLVLEIAGSPPRLIQADFDQIERPPADCIAFGRRTGR